MKNVKMFALAAIAVGVLMVCGGVGTATATELTCGSSLCAVGATFHAVSEGKTVIDAPFGNVECEVTVHGHVVRPGSGTTTATIEITEFKLTQCGNDNVIALRPGYFEIHTTETKANGDGTVTGAGMEITVEHVGTHCIFGTGTGHDIGWLTGSNNTGKTMTLDTSAVITRIGGRSGVFCGSSAPVTASDEVDVPMTGEVH